jgi:hypothetical protein
MQSPVRGHSEHSGATALIVHHCCEVIMRKRRGSHLAIDSVMAATSSALTLWHRLPMFGLASTATAAECQTEAARMVDEKARALIEGCLAANLEAVRVLGAIMTGQVASLWNAPMTIASAGLKPAFRTVNANAKRLNRRAARNALGG